MMDLNDYEPLPHILFADDFDKGYNGWITLMPNFRQDKFAYYDSFKDWTEWGPPMTIRRWNPSLLAEMVGFLGFLMSYLILQ